MHAQRGKLMKKILWFSLLILVASCLACSHSGGLTKPASYSFVVDIPEGWRKIDNNRYLFVTRENPFQQYILVQNRPIGKSFRHTKKKMHQTMLPEEAAQIVIDELISDQNLLNLKLLNNAPETIKGFDGFKILYTYQDAEGHAFKTLYYGFIKEDTFFNLRFTASDRYHFQRDIEAFRFMLNSFEIIKAETT
jgi:hypothetical protein